MLFLKNLFGFSDQKKPQENKPEVQQTSVPIPLSDRSWIAESILQFVSSPSFLTELQDFKEENCLTFNTEEESTHQHFILFKSYSKLLESKLEKLVADLGISGADFCEAAFSCYNEPRYRRFVEELFCIQDFLFFKKTMIRENRKLESEILRQNGSLTQKRLIEHEQREFEYALVVSKRMHDEYLSDLEQEQLSLEQTLEMSKKNYEEEVKRLQEISELKFKEKSKVEIVSGLSKLKNLEIEQKKNLEEKKILEAKKLENEKTKREVAEKLEFEKNEIQNRLFELQKLKEANIGNGENEEAVNTSTKINLGKAKEVDEVETSEERKERLDKQRQKLVESRKEQRHTQLELNKPAEKLEGGKPEFVDKEKIKRKEIYEELLKEKII